ncbi:hypothetical protein HHK36_016349 [Tetracentron sinense]|uniref:Subtilisin inhibitor 1 n=1 Tax=Tetracentron sinense TaxID=13715 RepID=A0A834Z3A0_TETSI|nr:hypothetical protein HHK36_016349 [Tetracentron sinense]
MAEKNQETGIPQEQPAEPLNQHCGENSASQVCLFGGNTGPKAMWPEVVGLTAEEAEKKIKEDMPMARFQVVPLDSVVTMDYNPRRVRLFVDSSSKVAKPPRIG